MPNRAVAFTFDFTMYSDGTGDALSGLTVTSQISKDGAIYAATTNSPVEIGSGRYRLTLTATEMDADTVSVKLTAAGALQADVFLYTQQPKVDLDKWLGMAPLALASQLVQVQANQLGIQAKADVNAEVDAALDTAIPATPTADSVNDHLKRIKEVVRVKNATVQAGSTTNVVNTNLTEPGGYWSDGAVAFFLDGANAGLSRRIHSYSSTGAMTVVDPLPAIPAARDTLVIVPASTAMKMQQLTSGVIGANSFAANAIDAAALATDAAQEIADALLDRVSAVDGYTPRQILRILAAILAGLVDYSTGPGKFKAVDGSKVRATVTHDGQGNRTNVVLDGA